MANEAKATDRAENSAKWSRRGSTTLFPNILDPQKNVESAERSAMPPGADEKYTHLICYKLIM